MTEFLKITKKEVIACLLMLMCITEIVAKTALVVIAHGSPQPAWRKPVLELEPMLNEKIANGKLRGIDYVRVAMMEFTEPTIATVISDCEQQEIDTVFAIPLFIAPSSHSDQDVPTILGHKFDLRTVAELRKEGTRVVRTRIPIIIGPTLSYDNILEKIMTDNVQAMSKYPSDESLLFIAHGDKQWDSFWRQKMESIANVVRRATGISDVDFKFVAMEQNMAEVIAPAVKKYAMTKDRILIQGVYLASTAKELSGMGIAETIARTLAGQRVEVIYSDRGILPSHSDIVVDWIVDRVNEWKNRRW